MRNLRGLPRDASKKGQWRTLLCCQLADIAVCVAL